MWRRVTWLIFIEFSKELVYYEDICDFHTVDVGHAGILGCYAEWQGCWFQKFWGNVPHASSGVAVSLNSTMKIKAVGFLFKTSVIISPASQRNKAQDVNLQATKLHDLKSQKGRNFDTYQFGK